MRKALSEYYSETENDPQLVDIWAELETTYHDRAGPSITLTNSEGDNLVASLSQCSTCKKRPTGENQAKIRKQQR